ncbi:hypothetical protein [Marinifilum caeruleilacunae]|uniref:Uncharacterized protein n=1 Tax=Marinifilum caeruleilacunae TaxID=2499076 RepID=A0ABX1WYM5_9BACT|nr:hypothetical protein [Marinifilum caeruleilacunae]NOU61245.1 hypothetical protein [Marinifilum caeruleilacunae]
MVDSTAFSIENRQKILEEATANEFDFVFTHCGFKEALFCLMASNLGFRCAIFCEQDFEIELHTVVDAKNAGSKSIISLRERFPHLILPDEYLHIQKEKSRFAALFSNRIKEKDLPRYESALKLAPGSSVNLESEFKINANRLLMSMIKSAVANGVIILNHVKCEKGNDKELVVSDGLQLITESYSVHYNKLLDFRSSDGEHKTELHMCLDKKGLFLKRSLKFHVDNQVVRLIRYQDYFLLISESEDVGIDFVNVLLRELSALFEDEISFNENDILSSQLMPVDSTSNLKDQLSALEKECKKHLNVSGSEFVERLHKFSIVDSHFEGRKEIQELIEFADFKFDEAKQTGIHPISFKNVFYRFGSESDQLTELAYEWRVKYGPGEKLWQNVQLWYLYNHEMICSMNDYYARINSLNKPGISNLTIDEEVMNKCLFV